MNPRIWLCASVPAAMLTLLTGCAGRAPGTSPSSTPAPSVAAPTWTVPSAPVVPAPDQPRIAARDLLGRARYGLPVVAHPKVVAEVEFLAGPRHWVIAEWLARGDPYESFVKRVLREHGLPEDLYYLSLVESGFRPTIRSRAGAVGLWQFMPATGRASGLRIDEEVDERMDPVRSTRAAARHLRALYREHGDWALVAASYNAGSGRVRRAIARTGTRNFWELAERSDLATETKQYVPRLYAVTILAKNREQWRFPRPEPGPEFRPDSAEVDVPMPLSELARLGDISESELLRMNPHLRDGWTPARRYPVWVPAGLGAGLRRAYRDSEVRRGGGFARYLVRTGDGGDSIAAWTGLTLERVAALNRGLDLTTLRPGMRIVLPRPALARLAARSQPERARLATRETARPASHGAPTAVPAMTAAPAAKRDSTAGVGDLAGEIAPIHTVKAGETLDAVARRYRVTADALREANGLLRGDPLGVGRTLVIPASPAGETQPRR